MQLNRIAFTCPETNNEGSVLAHKFCLKFFALFESKELRLLIFSLIYWRIISYDCNKVVYNIKGFIFDFGDPHVSINYTLITGMGLYFHNNFF